MTTEKKENDNSLQGLISLTEIRRDVYIFLSKIFWKELSLDEVKNLPQKVEALKLLPDVLGSEDQEMAQAINLLARTTQGFAEGKNEDVVRELRTEYAGLFLGVRQKPPHPSESVYRSSTHLLMQKERDEVLFAYQEAGFEKDSSFKEPEDHIALELSFMAALASGAVECLKKKDMSGFERSLKQQEKFLREHLGLWIGELAHDIDKSARIDFYMAVGDLAVRFIHLDEKLIEESLASLSALMHQRTS